MTINVHEKRMDQRRCHFIYIFFYSNRIPLRAFFNLSGFVRLLRLPPRQYGFFLITFLTNSSFYAVSFAYNPYIAQTLSRANDGRLYITRICNVRLSYRFAYEFITRRAMRSLCLNVARVGLGRNKISDIFAWCRIEN